MCLYVLCLVEDAEYMIMNCPSGGPSDLRESTTAEAHLTEEPISVTSTERLQQGVSPALMTPWFDITLKDLLTWYEL